MPAYIDNLITDRIQDDVDYLISLCEKGWKNMTTEEKTYFNAANSRGAYNISDVLRVNTAQTRIASLFNSVITNLSNYFDIAVADVLSTLRYNKGFYDLSDIVLDPALKEVSYATPVQIQTVNNDWQPTDLPANFDGNNSYVYDISYYLNNMNYLRQLLPIEAPNTPETLERLTYEEANDIEKILIAIYNVVIKYRTDKENAIWDAEDAEVDKQDRAARSWIWSNEVYAGEV